MRRKYFVRGMGVGIIVTALVFTVALFFTEDTMSKNDIIKEAEKYGMIMPDANTLENTEPKASDNKETKTSSDSSTNSTTESKGSETENSDIKTTTDSTGAKITQQTLTGEDVTEPPKETTDPTTEKNNASHTSSTQTTVSRTESSNDIISFTVRTGENSSIIAANLYKAGLVENPSNFDKFLESNGYDKSLRTGSFSIRKGSSEESIAKTLTGR